MQSQPCEVRPRLQSYYTCSCQSRMPHTMQCQNESCTDGVDMLHNTQSTFEWLEVAASHGASSTSAESMLVALSDKNCACELPWMVEAQWASICFCEARWETALGACILCLRWFGRPRGWGCSCFSCGWWSEFRLLLVHLTHTPYQHKGQGPAAQDEHTMMIRALHSVHGNFLHQCGQQPGGRKKLDHAEEKVRLMQKRG